MAQRVYRHDMHCTHCGFSWFPKAGKSRGKQTYRRGDCQRRFTLDGNRHYYLEKVKRPTLNMYGEGTNVSAIGRALGADRWIWAVVLEYDNGSWDGSDTPARIESIRGIGG